MKQRKRNSTSFLVGQPCILLFLLVCFISLVIFGHNHVALSTMNFNFKEKNKLWSNKPIKRYDWRLSIGPNSSLAFPVYNVLRGGTCLW